MEKSLQCMLRDHTMSTVSLTVISYDYETYAPISTNGNGGLGFIGMQRCTDCSSSPIADLASRQASQGWASSLPFDP